MSSSVKRLKLIIMALQEKFDEATNTVSKKINKTLTDEELKEVYGLYKQVKTFWVLWS